MAAPASTTGVSSPSVSKCSLMPAWIGGDVDLEAAADGRIGHGAVIGREHQHPSVLAHLVVQERHEPLEREVLRHDGVAHLERVHRPHVADVVDLLEVEVQQVGHVVLAEPLVLDHGLDRPAPDTACAPACRTPSAAGRCCCRATDRRAARRPGPPCGRPPRTPGRRSRTSGACSTPASRGGRFHSNPSSVSVSPPITERVSAMSRSPPVKNEPCPSIPKWMSTVPTMPTTGSLSMATVVHVARASARSGTPDPRSTGWSVDHR